MQSTVVQSPVVKFNTNLSSLSYFTAKIGGTWTSFVDSMFTQGSDLNFKKFDSSVDNPEAFFYELLKDDNELGSQEWTFQA